MRKTLPLIGLLSTAIAFNVHAANDESLYTASNWYQAKAQSILTTAKLNSKADKSSRYSIDFNSLTNIMLSQESSFIVTLPLPQGNFAQFKLTPSSVMSQSLQDKYPNIRTFSGYQIDNPKNNGRFDITPQGFHGMLNYSGKTVFIEPQYRDNPNQYHSYFREDALPLSIDAIGKRLAPLRHQHNADQTTHQQHAKSQRTNSELRTFRIAIATTAEYTQFHGGTKAKGLAALVTLVNRVNDVYQRDLAVKLELVANNDAIIFTDGSSDPFDNTDNDIDKVTETINNAIGEANYDIGHIVGTGGGGLAGLGVVCGSAKAEGLTGSSSPTGDSFHIDYVAHEIGHQFGADHTFNGGEGGCGGNRGANSAYEPGSASTIMSYAGLCGGQDLQQNSDPYFHVHSLDEMNAFLATSQGQSCGTKTSLNNNPPTVNAGNDYTIPARTPFKLSGQATDPDNDTLAYSWEQYDLGPQSNSAADDKTDDGKRPLFRVWSPIDNAERTFPRLADILSNQPKHGEALPTTNRALNFRLVVRDNKGNVADDAMKITVVTNQSGFAVTDPTTGTSWNGSSQTVKWNTANSESAPVSCSAVDILLSTDSGLNFNQTLVSQTPNDGEQTITLPNVNTNTGRIKVACSNNIFFAINQSDISINSDGSGEAPTPEITGQQALNVNEDQSIQLERSHFTYANNLSVDSLSISAGSNYQVSGSTITPNSNFNGTLSVVVKAIKGSKESQPFTATVTVAAVNDQPTAVNDTATVQQGSTNNTISVIGNDSDIDGDSLTVSAINYTGTGSATISNNIIVYTPASSFNGTETLSYTLSDGNGGQATATLTITVNPSSSGGNSGGGSGGNNGGNNNSGGSSGGGSLSYLLMLLLGLSRSFSKKGNK